MKNKFTSEDLINFERDIIQEWKKGNTYGPIHLSGSINKVQEDFLVNLFNNEINEKNWIFGTHRSHYIALLKSQDEKWLMDEIINKAHSSHINSKKHRIFSSAIVGGNIPIALGVALANKLEKKDEYVYCFVGDMAAQMGCFWEAVKYAIGYDLPIKFIIEDNEIGCDTPTKEVWKENINISSPKIIHYKYKRLYPHCGCNFIINFKKKKFKSSGNYDAYK